MAVRSFLPHHSAHEVAVVIPIPDRERIAGDLRWAADQHAVCADMPAHRTTVSIMNDRPQSSGVTTNTYAMLVCAKCKCLLDYAIWLEFFRRSIVAFNADCRLLCLKCWSCAIRFADSLGRPQGRGRGTVGRLAETAKPFAAELRLGQPARCAARPAPAVGGNRTRLADAN